MAFCFFETIVIIENLFKSLNKEIIDKYTIHTITLKIFCSHFKHHPIVEWLCNYWWTRTVEHLILIFYNINLTKSILFFFYIYSFVQHTKKQSTKSLENIFNLLSIISLVVNLNRLNNWWSINIKKIKRGLVEINPNVWEWLDRGVMFFDKYWSRFEMIFI